jgi:ATPase subunit of ABC transporter with duplicated ATPase domains
MIEATLVDEPVRVTGIVKRYGRRTVLDRVSLVVRPGITGLVGPNGAGKSTLVKSILGLVRLAEGSVRVFGLDPRQEPRRVRSGEQRDERGREGLRRHTRIGRDACQHGQHRVVGHRNRHRLQQRPHQATEWRHRRRRPIGRRCMPQSIEEEHKRVPMLPRGKEGQGALVNVADG